MNTQKLIDRELSLQAVSAALKTLGHREMSHRSINALGSLEIKGIYRKLNLYRGKEEN